MKRIVATVFLLLSLLWAESGEVSPELLELANTEKRFAATAGKVGVRDAFLEYFAEDSILFQPAPMPAVEDLRKQPPDPKPLQVLLEWEPLTGEISADGEFGYLTGPTRTTDLSPRKRPQRYGMYFSVWRKTGGAWKVIVDGGTGTPGPVAEIGKLEFRRNQAAGAQVRTASVESRARTPAEAEAALAEALAKDKVEGFVSFAAPNARLYRSGNYPIETPQSIRSYLAKAQDVHSPEVQGSGVSKAGDLGYAYGAYAGTPNYFLRMWRRDAAGEWKIVYDIMYEPRPQPPAQPQS